MKLVERPEPQAARLASLSVREPGGGSRLCRHYAELESRVLNAEGIEGVALRYGFFYGPGTWYNPDGPQRTRRESRNW